MRDLEIDPEKSLETDLIAKRAGQDQEIGKEKAEVAPEIAIEKPKEKAPLQKIGIVDYREISVISFLGLY